MNNQLVNLAYVRKKERKSLFFVISILLFSSFMDEAYFFIKMRIMEPAVVIETKPLSDNDQVDQHAIATISNIVQEKKSDAIEVQRSSYSHSQDSKSFKSTTAKAHSNSKNDYHIKHDQYKDADSDNNSSLHSPEFSSGNANQKSHRISSSPSGGLSSIDTKHLPTAKLPAVLHINPNAPDLNDLTTAGIPERVAKTWIKYTKAGGSFNSRSDLEKIYGLNEALIAKVSPHLRFPKVQKPKFNNTLSSIFINQATSLDFAKIPGIGPVLSERIIKFRDKLGGFYSYGQITEVFGIEPVIIEKHKNLFLIEQPVTKIAINECDETTLAAHSYCSYRQAKAIINYRSQHGAFEKEDDLLKIRIVDEKWLEKIAPYLAY